MKAAKRAKLIAEAVNAGRLAGHRPIIYATIDIVTGLGDKPYMLAIPFLPNDLLESGHLKIDLPKMGFKIVMVDDGASVPGESHWVPFVNDRSKTE